MTKRKDYSFPSKRRFAHLPVAERFLSWCIPEPNSGCWLWEGTTGAGRPGGRYGGFKLGHMMTAPRASVLLFKAEEIPKGAVVAHICDVKLCVNPDHLRITTHGENTREAWERGTGKATRAARAAARRGGSDGI
ncbi:MAG: HNH endonuclease signature motif containing protein [Vicinamibacterales bacterium]